MALPQAPRLPWLQEGGEEGLPLRFKEAFLRGLGRRAAYLPGARLLGYGGEEGEDIWVLVADHIALLPLRPGALEDPEVQGALALAKEVLVVESGDQGDVATARAGFYLEEAADLEGVAEALAVLEEDLTPEAENRLADLLEAHGWQPLLATLHALALRRARGKKRLPRLLQGPASRTPIPPWSKEVLIPDEADPSKLTYAETVYLPVVVVVDGAYPDLQTLLLDLIEEEWRMAMEIGAVEVAGHWQVRSEEEALALGRALGLALLALEWVRVRAGDRESPDFPEGKAWRSLPGPPPPLPEALEAPRWQRRLRKLPHFLPPPLPGVDEAAEEVLLD